MKNQVFRFLTMAALTTTMCMVAGAQEVKTTVYLPHSPIGITADPLRNRIYAVTPADYGSANDNLAVIDGKTDTLLTNLPVPVGSSFVSIDYLYNRIYVAGCDSTNDPISCTVTVLNGYTGETVKTIPVTSTAGLGLTGIVADPLKHRVYVANASDKAVNVIDGINEKLIASIDMGSYRPRAIALNLISDLLYVPFGNNLTAVVSPKKKAVLSTTTFGTKTVGVAADMLSGKVYVTDAASATPSQIGILDRNGSEITALTVDSAPLGVDVDPFTKLAFVASRALDSVTVIDGSTNEVKVSVSGVPASYLAVNPITEKVYVSGRTGVTVITEK